MKPLPEGSYVFSWHTKQQTSVLVRRPWWNLFGKDRIEYVEVDVLKVIYDLPADVATVIKQLSDQNWNHPAGKLLMRLMDDKGALYNVQLGQLTQASSYISISSGYVKL